jgi:3-oxosteroid 1-dehydrogenase
MKKSKVAGSRRKFLKKMGGGAVGVAAASSVSLSGCSSPLGSWDSTYDWVCIGSGIEGGLAASIYGHDLGFKTLLIEESDLLGGNAGFHSLFYVPQNHLMTEAGIPDSRDEAQSWLRYVGGGYNSSEFIDAFVDHAPRAVEYIHKKAGVEFWMCAAPDFWHQQSEGGFRYREDISVGSKKEGRSITVESFPAASLGDWRYKIRQNEFYDHFEEVLEGQEHNPSLGMLSSGKRTMGVSVGLQGPLRGVETVALRLWRERLGSQAVDALIKKDEEEFVAGAAYIAYMLRAMIQREIEVRMETRAVRLVEENGRVVGVVVNHQGKEERIRANRGIMLGGGLGDSWRLATGVGGEVYSKIRLPSLTGFDVTEAPGITSNRGRNYEMRARHSMMVNRNGERFASEEAYQGATALLDFDALGEHRFRNLPSYYIFDTNLIEKYSFAGRPPGATEGLDWLAQGNTITELAQKLNIPAAQLEATVANFNEHARNGTGDPDYHRTAHTMRPLEKPPFYGVMAHKEAPETDPLKGYICVVTDTNGQVVHYDTKAPIPGLYATTQLQEHQGVLGVGYQAGLHTAQGHAFSLLAAEHAAEKKLV